MEFIKVMNQRRSCRNFKNDNVSDEIITRILDIANTAPCTDTCNYFFGAIKNDDIKKKIGKATVYADWVSNAPVIFVVCSNITSDIREAERDSYHYLGLTGRYKSEVVDFLVSADNRKAIKTLLQASPAYIAAQHIILAANDNGLRGGLVDFINIEKINSILELPEYITCELLVPIGYHEAEAKPVNTNDEENSFFDKWKKK